MRFIVFLCLPWALPAALVYPPLPYPGPAGSSGARTVQTLNYPTLNKPTLNNPTLNYPTLNNPTLNKPALNNPALNYPTLNYPTLTYRPLDKEKDADYDTTEYPYVVETHLYTLEETTMGSAAIEDTTNWLMEDTTNSVKVVSNNDEDASDSAEVTTVGMSKKNTEMIEETNEAMLEDATIFLMENQTMNLPLVEVTTKTTVEGTIQAMVERTTEAINEGIIEVMNEGVLELEAMNESITEDMNKGTKEDMNEGTTDALNVLVESTTIAMVENTTAAIVEGTTKATKAMEEITITAMKEGAIKVLVENTTSSFSENAANLMEEGTADTTEMDNATSVKLDTVPASCAEVMTNNGLNISNFSHGAAQGIHSLHLEEIREFFEPEAPFINKIPVVNDDLSSEQVILFDAPLAGYDNDFKTMALKVMAHFMLNPHLGPQNMNTLEKVSHQYLMHEVYAAAAPIYQRIKETPPTDPKLCPCVKDITGNGILTDLVNIVHQRKRSGSIRYPGSNAKTVNSNTGSEEALSAAEQQYLADSSQENAMRLLELRPWTPNTLTGPEQWVSFEAMLTTLMLNQEELTDFATFMFCKLDAAE